MDESGKCTGARDDKLYRFNLKLARCVYRCTPNLMFPASLKKLRRELTPYSRIAQAGCRGVTGPVPQPLFMKLRLAP